MSARAVKLAKQIISRWEGCHLEPYKCPAGFPTVGFGRLLGPRSADLDDFRAITQDEADSYLEEDVRSHMNQVLGLIDVPLTDAMLAALTSFTYNLGAGRLEASTLRRVINRGHYCEAPRQFERWVWAGGVKLRGLVRRRDDEIALWESEGLPA